MLDRTESQLNDPLLISRYEVGARIASGSFGAVYEARQRTTGQAVAVKILRLDRGEIGGEDGGEEGRDQFRREMQLCAVLHHPNIVRLIDSGEVKAGAGFAVFEFIPGTNLADVLATEGALDPWESVHLMEQVLDALACAHSYGIVHRDLKPANIMITDTGARRNALVMDFGLGTFYDVSRSPDFWHESYASGYQGTPAYSAPEQLLGESPAAAADLFAWGLTFIECLTGVPAFDGPAPQVIHRKLSPDAIAVPKGLGDHELGRILQAVTRKDPTEREDSAPQLLEALRQLARDPLPILLPSSGAPADGDSESTKSGSLRLDQLSRVWRVPVRRNTNFVGRDGILAQLRDAHGGENDSSIVALRGMGGVGKTHIALEFAYRFGHSYDLVAWLRAGDLESLTEDYTALAEPLRLRESSSPDQRLKIEAVRTWFEKRSDWLLIFDNAPNPDALREFLPRTSTGHILITSRHPSWRDLGISIEVEELGSDEAIHFLMQRTGDPNAAAADRLASELGRLPLALEEASAYIEATGRSTEDYLELLLSQQEVLLRGADASRGSALRGTWELSFRQLESEQPEGADLLRLCAFLAPDDIPFTLLRDAREELPAPLSEALGAPIQFDQCLAALRRYSLVKVEKDGVRVHRLVQLATRERLTTDERADWASRALCVTNAVFPREGLAGNYRADAGRLLPHALAAIDHAHDHPGCGLETGQLLHRAGNYLSARGFHHQACRYHKRSIDRLRSLVEPQERQIANVLADNCLAHYALGELDTALEQVEPALEIHEKLRGAKHFRVALDLISLGFVRRALGDYDVSRDASRRAAEIIDEQLGPDHPMCSMALSILSRSLWGLGDVAGAREVADRAIGILLEQPVYHPLLCSSWNNLGRVQLDLGSLDTAEICVTRSLEIGERAYGADHPLVAISTAMHGSLLALQGDLGAALGVFDDAVARGERNCRLLHQDIAMARSEAGDALRRLGQHDSARERLEHVQLALDRVCGNRSRLASHVEASVAALCVATGDPTSGHEHALRALAAFDERYAADHPIRVLALCRLAEAEAALGHTAAARAGLDEALGIGDRHLDPAHPLLAEARGLVDQAGRLSPNGPILPRRALCARSQALLRRCLAPTSRCLAPPRRHRHDDHRCPEGRLAREPTRSHVACTSAEAPARRAASQASLACGRCRLTLSVLLPLIPLRIPTGPPKGELKPTSRPGLKAGRGLGTKGQGTGRARERHRVVAMIDMIVDSDESSSVQAPRICEIHPRAEVHRMINVTEAASERIRDLLDKDDKLPSHGLRMKVIGGGCSGLQYELSFDDSTGDADHTVEAGPVRIFVDEKSALYLAGTTLDFIDTLQETGFKIDNPNASNTCGCGQSFAA